MVDIGQNWIYEIARIQSGVTTQTLDYMGYYNKFSIKEERKVEDKTYFGDDTTSDDFENRLTAITGIDRSGSMSFYPYDLTKLNQCIVKSNDLLETFFVGAKNKLTNKTKYTDRAYINNLTLSLPESGFVEVSTDLKFGDLTSSTNDYVGIDINGITYSHGTIPTQSAYTTKDLTSVTFAGISIKPSKFDIKIEYDLDEKVDNTSDTTYYKVKSRSISVDGLELATDNSQFEDAIVNETVGDFVFTLGINTVTVSDVLFPNIDLDIESGSVATQTFSSGKVGKITIA